MAQKVILMILDGWGFAPNPKVSAVDLAKTPVMDDLSKKYAYAELLTDGENVGLPNGQMGNSEVGHMNLGAGRIVYQDLVKISKAIEDKSIEKNKVLREAFNHAKKAGKKVHFLGLLSDGGVHSHLDHLIPTLPQSWNHLARPQMVFLGYQTCRNLQQTQSLRVVRPS